jgi:energy-converting hydrogenase Eha subunit E
MRFLACSDKMLAVAFLQLNIGQIGPSLVFPKYPFTLALFVGFPAGIKRTLLHMTEGIEIS